MLFNSLHFLFFFPITCIIYYLLPTVRMRNFFLLVASYYFYMNWNASYALLLLTSTFITYVAAIRIEKVPSTKQKKAYLIASLVTNLSILFFFKYYNFAISTINEILFPLNNEHFLPPMHLLLPVGISFYIFQALGYSIDVYRGHTKSERDFLTYALFVSFFPQLVAGPIERSTHLLPQFKEKHKFSHNLAMEGIRLMVWGFFLKLVLADRCSLYVDSIYNNLEEHNGGSYLLAAILFTFQIYGDFSGYSLIAIGAARVMGFHLMDNFRRPYLATSVTEFWHRWHISLSTWFKDYVYIPLGGNRVSQWKNYLNIMVTFTISGIWHGANWTFIAWGALHGLLQCAEKRIGWAKREWKGTPRVCHMMLTFSMVCLTWIIFRANSLKEAVSVIQGIITHPGAPYVQMADFIAIGIALFIVACREVAEEWHTGIRVSDSQSWVVRHLYITTMIAYIILFGVLNGDQFIYFQF